MNLSLPFYIGARYTKARRRNGFISFISLASMLGIALGVVALIVVLSVMNGFDTEIKTRILSMTPHMNVMGYANNLNSWQQLQEKLSLDPNIEGVSPFIEGQGMFIANSNSRGGVVKGIVPSHIDEVFPLSSHINLGALQALETSKNGVILGTDLAQNLQLELGDKITFIIPESISSPYGVMPRLKRFELVGTFKVGYLFDNAYAFVNLDDAAKLFHTKDSVTGLQVKLANYLAAPRIGRELSQKYPGEYYFSDWTLQNANYFHAVKMEKTLMFLILTLIVAVAAFNLVSTLVMVVTDKTADIAILRTMGASSADILKIFINQGMIIGVIGTSLGLIFGVLLANNVTALVDFVQHKFAVELLSKDIYFISFLPSKLQISDVIKVCSMSLFMSFIATIYPAYRAAKVAPAEALRYE